MSWDGYVDSVIGGSKASVTEATLVGLNGSIWTPVSDAKPQIMKISQTEATNIASAMAKKDLDTKGYFAANGITINGIKYMFLRDMNDDGRVMSGKKVGVGAITIQSTVQAIVIAFTPEKDAHGVGNAVTAVDNICKYLEGVGY